MPTNPTPPMPKPLSAKAVRELEAADKKVYRTRTGEAFATRAERRAWRLAHKNEEA